MVKYIIWFQKISIPPPWMVFQLDPPPWKLQFIFILSFKNFGLSDPYPLGISNDNPWGGYGYFLEPHIKNM